MAIKDIKLLNFRNFKEKRLEFARETTVIVGPNAAGKTNILEAVHMLSTGKSFRAGVEGEVVSYNSEVARIAGKVDGGTQSTNLDIVLTRGQVTVGDKIQKTSKKKFLVNGVPRRLVDFSGNLKTVLFGPWDMDLVSGSPSLRRNFLDTVLCQTDREYRRSLVSYEKGVRQRNKILWDLREARSASSGHASIFVDSTGSPRALPGRERLHFWDKLLIKNGNYISQQRESFINFANAGLISTNNYQLPISNFQLIYDKSVISEARLSEYEERELASAQTLVGPHRDDIAFQILNSKSETRNLATFGSRGEQRMGVLWLKMCELKYIENQTRLRQDSGETKPTLLLDDIFSELDHEHRDLVMDIVGGQQTIITTADEHFIESLPQSTIIKLK